MPTNKKESIIFTTLMCFLMVLGMSAYNLFLHQAFTWSNLMKGLPLGFIVAFLLDIFIIGKIAKKLAFKLPINKEKKIQVILSISICMVCGMVLCMSLYGILIESFTFEGFLMSYSTAILRNFIFALPLQLMIVGPISRNFLTNVQTIKKKGK